MIVDHYFGGSYTPPTPTPYTNLSYIYAESSGSNLDLHISYVLTTNFKIRLLAEVRAETDGVWIGRTASARFFGLNGAVYSDIEDIFNRLSGDSATFGAEIGDYMDVTLTNHTMYNDETGIGYTGTTASSITAMDYFNVRLSHLNVYGIEVWDGDTKHLNLVPAKRNSDNKCGLYDTIGKHFYGSDDFTIIGV